MRLLKVKSYWKLKYINRFAFIIAAGCSPALAQLAEAPSPSAVPFIFPIKPGTPASLAGTMGELRSTHFHTGIDIRTKNQLGWPVRAAAAGYVSRATVTPGGFGLALYVKHPNGYTTVYGHLERFRNDIQEYVRRERYRKKQSVIDLYFRKDQFPVNTGDTIAFSGNSGSSAGPHLHFDIRNENNHALNPAAFDFKEIVDHSSPIVRKVALRPLDIHARVNDVFNRTEFYVVRSGNHYHLPEPILAYGNIGLEVLAYDLVDHPAYKCGINFIEVTANNNLIFKQSLTQINLNDSRQIFTATNFQTFKETGNQFYKLYVDYGNTLPFYESINRGVIGVTGDEPIKVQVTLKDAHQNVAYLHLTLKPSPPPVAVKWLEPAQDITWNTDRHVWKITTPTCPVNALAWRDGEPYVLEPAYLNTATTVYLINLKQPLPDSVVICRKKIIPPVKAVVFPQNEFTFTSPAIDVRFGRHDLFDTLYFDAQYLINEDSVEIFRIGNKNIPLKQSVEVTLRPARLPQHQHQWAAYRLQGKGYVYIGGKWTGQALSFYTRDFGDFVILPDTLPPTITPLQVNRKEIRLRIRDDLSGVRDYSATLNGQWLLLNYDEKTRTLEAEPLVPGTPMKGDLVVTITDNVGNQSTYRLNIP
jgi:hypothetical protein